MLAALPSLYHLTVCGAHRLGAGDGPRLHGVAGALAGGVSLLAFPNTSVAMYTLWKCIEVRGGPTACVHDARLRSKSS